MAARIAIIGAGMSGLACAQRLHEAGCEVSLFDKGRGPGGRMSSRRASVDGKEMRFDHGAQYFTARDPQFRQWIDAQIDAGRVGEWQGRFVTIVPDGRLSPARAQARYVGLPAMNGLIRSMAAPFNVAWNSRVSAIKGGPGCWRLVIEDDAEQGDFEQVVLAIPAEQAAPLLRPVAPELADVAASAVSAPCWTVMLSFAAPFGAPFDAASIEGHALSWLARDASKPGRTSEETWVAQAGPDWSRQHIEDSAETVTAALLADLQSIFPVPEVTHLAAHRWLYARVETPASGPGFLPALGLAICGDWRLGPRVESAWLSGRDAATACLSANGCKFQS